MGEHVCYRPYVSRQAIVSVNHGKKYMCAENFLSANLVCRKPHACVHLAGVSNIQANLKEQELVVESALPSAVLLDAIQATGRKAVLYGQGTLKGTCGMLVCGQRTLTRYVWNV